MLSGTDLSKPVREAIEDEKVSAYSTFHAIAEAEYILCRSKGRETARAKVESLIQSGTVELVEARSLVHDAALLKCERAIALTDAFTLALAEKIGGLAFFARPEDDLTREERRRPFATRLAFLEDFKRVKPKEA